MAGMSLTVDLVNYVTSIADSLSDSWRSCRPYFDEDVYRKCQRQETDGPVSLVVAKRDICYARHARSNRRVGHDAVSLLQFDLRPKTRCRGRAVR